MNAAQLKRVMSAAAITPFVMGGFLVSGCASLEHVHVNDENVRDVAGSVVFRPESMHFEGRHAGRGGIELGYERHLGEGTQSINGSDVVSIGGQTFTAPQVIVNRADSEHGHIAYNQLLSYGEYFEIEPSLGLALDVTDVTVRSSSPATPVITLHEKNWGLNAGLTPRWNFNNYVAMEARVRVSVARDSGNSSTILPSIVLRPTDNIAIHAGYVWYSQSLDTPIYNSNIDIKFEGPSVALRLEF